MEKRRQNRIRHSLPIQLMAAILILALAAGYAPAQSGEHSAQPSA